MPPRLEQTINKVIENIRPPAPGPEVTSQLNRAAATFKASITTAIKNHLQAQAEESKAALEDLNHEDWRQAENLAKNRYNKRFGTRARNDTVTHATAALKRVFAKDWTRPKKTAKIPTGDQGGPRIPLENRFEQLEEEEDGEPALDALLAAMDAIPPTPPAGSTFRVPTRPRRRQASSPEMEGPTKRKAANRTPDNGRPAPTPQPGPSIPAPPTPTPSLITPVVSPTTAGVRTYADVVIGNPRQPWHIGNIPPTISSIVLTDSNGLSWRNTGIPENTIVYALRGGRLGDGVRMLNHDKEQLRSVRTIICALGLNDRDRDPSDTIGNVRFLHDWSKRSDKNVLFLGVPPFDTLNETERNNIEFLNNSARDIFGEQFIEPLPAKDVHITDRDGYGIHYSVNTATATLELIQPYLN